MKEKVDKVFDEFREKSLCNDGKRKYVKRKRTNSEFPFTFYVLRFIFLESLLHQRPPGLS